MDGSIERAFPTPETSDTEEVRAALETAASLWPHDAREALRFLRRAAESAADAGDDARSVFLAHAAADLRSQASLGSSIAPTSIASAPIAAAPIAPEPVAPVAAGGGEVNAGATAGVPDTAPAGDPAADAEPGAEAAAAQASRAEGASAQAVTINQAVPAQVLGFGGGALEPIDPKATIPRFAAMTLDPGQTVPATPAAAAAVALQEAAAQALNYGAPLNRSLANDGLTTVPGVGPEPSSSSATWPTGALAGAANPQGAGASATDSADGPVSSTHSPVSVTPSSITSGSATPGSATTPGSIARSWSPVQAAAPAGGASLSNGGASGMAPVAAGQYGLSAAMAASTPTPVEVPAVRRQVAEAAAKRAIAGVRPAEHRALRVAVSPVPNAAGNFEIRPLNEGEQPAAGWKQALLVALDGAERLLPDRS